MYRKKSFLMKLRPVPENCIFCREKTNPDYKNIDSLKNYVSERGRILGSDRTGICSKHQRRLAKEIKKARVIALLPFSSQIS